MSRKNVILGQNTMSYSKAIKEITGWTQKEFETQKRLMRYRVGKFNLITGSNLSPIEQLYYRVKYEDRKQYYITQGKEPAPLNIIQQTIQDMKTGNVNLKIGSKSYNQAIEIGKEFILNRFENFGKSFPKAQEILEQLRNGDITPRQAKTELEELAEDMRELKQNSPVEWIEAHDERFGS